MSENEIKTKEMTLTSMEVAEMVEKTHANLLKDIRTYVKQLRQVNAEVKIHLGDFFEESEYVDKNGQQRPCYLITKKGCEFVAHKMTGVKGAKFTAQYINRFHEMEDKLRQSVPTDTLGQIQLLAQGTMELDKKITSVANDLEQFKQDMPVLGYELDRIKYAKNHKVVPLMGGKNANAYKNRSLVSRVYADVDMQLRREFGVRSSKEIKRNQTDKAIEIINAYELPMVLQDEILQENAQQNLF